MTAARRAQIRGGSGTVNQEARLLVRVRKLTPARRAALMEYVEFLAARSTPAHARGGKAVPRPAHESVVQAIRRLTRTYPMIERPAIMAAVTRCLASHMIDGREATHVIDELECLFAAAARSPRRSAR